ncbi:MAG: glycosyltransferase family 1 protein [Ardenticatenaceae bacterium]|nr:glycosyltransferase family 1 protein [Anaerolineales bacterium]MCB8940552.1 glycosyltransferase family 1 protein [Ardenticatenaceae bacterium]MCB8973572.1 glycosyltransferase family 1 protein [Ardenticatenaceae bacterium]
MKHLTLLALGSRGDVFPSVILGAALQQAGYRVRLITFASFAPLVARFGLDFAAVPGDAEALLASSGGLALLESGQNVLKQYRALRQTFWQLTDGITNLLSQPDLWHTDGIINQLPASLYGRSLAEKLQIPLINIAVIPMLRTRAFPMVAFPTWPSFLPGYNALTYRLAEQLVWSGFRRSVNQWRQNVLGLGKRPFLGNFHPLNHTPTLLGFSPHIVPRPADWGPNVQYTGYWLPTEPDWIPPDELVQFLADGPPPILVSFGSMAVRDPQRLTALVLQAAQRAGQRLILQSGWAGLGQRDLPPTIFSLDYAPYRWLFPQLAAVVHHGGSGTTGFGFWAGISNILTPFLFDQFYWGKRIQMLGVGPAPTPQQTLTAEKLATAMATAVSDPTMRQKTAVLGEKIRQEDGLKTAVRLIEQLVS